MAYNAKDVIFDFVAQMEVLADFERNLRKGLAVSFLCRIFAVSKRIIDEREQTISSDGRGRQQRIDST